MKKVTKIGSVPWSDTEVVDTSTGEITAVETVEPEFEYQASREDLDLIRDLVCKASKQGVAIGGRGGLLRYLTKTVLETALEAEMSEHLGYEKHEQAGNGSGNSRNGTRSKTVLTDSVGPVEIEVPRDRAGTFTPVIVPKRKRRLSDIDEVILSLYAKGLTTGEISSHFAEIYGACVSKETISKITDKVIDEMVYWWSRPLETVYAAVFIDAIWVKIRDGQVANRPVYAAIGVDLQGNRDILGMWCGQGNGESAKFWMQILTELRNRGVKDIFFMICDGLKGMPETINTVFPETIVQTCVIHLIRGSFRYASSKDREALARDMKPIYQAMNETDARAGLDRFEETWGKKYPAMIRMWHNAWEEFIPFLDYDIEIRRIIYSTNAIESLNARFRRAIKARGHFPTEAAAMKILYLVTRSLDPKGTGQKRWVARWKPALNAFAITFKDRFPVPEKQ